MKIIALAVLDLVLLISMISSSFVEDDDVAGYSSISKWKLQRNVNSELTMSSSPGPYSSVNIIVEFKLPEFDNASISDFVSRLVPLGFLQDVKFGIMPIESENGQQTMIIHGSIDKGKMNEVEAVSGVVKVWKEGKEGIKPFKGDSNNINSSLYIE